MRRMERDLMPRRRLRSGEDIRRERERLGLTIEKAAYLMGVAVATLSRWERGIVSPASLTLRGVEGFLSDYRKSKKKGGEK